MSQSRKGTTLVELIVALPIAAIIGTVAMTLLLDTHKLTRRLNSTTELARELRQAAAVLAAEIRPLAAADLIAWSDTSLEMHALVGSGIVCASPAANVVDMLPLHGNDVLRTSWFALPQSGDQVFTVGIDSAIVPGAGTWHSTSLSGTATSASSPCITLPLLQNSTSSTANPVRLTLSTAITQQPATGSPIRIARRSRYSLYRASDGLWYMGRKTFGGAAWTTIQPVAGPFDRPQLHGLFIQVRDSANNIMPPGSPNTPRSVMLVMHASSAWQRSATVAGVMDSVLLHVTLRGQVPMVVP